MGGTNELMVLLLRRSGWGNMFKLDYWNLGWKCWAKTSIKFQQLAGASCLLVQGARFLYQNRPERSEGLLTMNSFSFLGGGHQLSPPYRRKRIFAKHDFPGHLLPVTRGLVTIVRNVGHANDMKN
jgi:hypothetical protein